VHPETKKEVRIEAVMPPDMEDLWQQLNKNQ
jgi:hypothetical protein